MALGCPRRAVAGRFAAALPVLTLAAVLLSGCTPVPPAAPAAKAPSAGPFRRVVTGLDALGRSAVIEDGPVPEAFRMSAATLPPEAIAAKPYLRYILETDPIWAGTLPVDNGSAPDVAGAPRSGPDDGLVPKLPRAGFVAVMFRWAPGGPSFPMHDSPTFDLAVVVSGAVELQLEAGSTVLRPGDVVVQRGTRHTWKVVSDEPCVMFGILLDATGKAGPGPAQK